MLGQEYNQKYVCCFFFFFSFFQIHRVLHSEVTSKVRLTMQMSTGKDIVQLRSRALHMHNCNWSEQDFIERKDSSCLSKETHEKSCSAKFRSAVMPHIDLVISFFFFFSLLKFKTPYILLYHFKTIKE